MIELPPNTRALVTDDDPDVRRIFSRILTGKGFEVASASDGVAAVAEIEAAITAGAPFGVAVVDLDMPGWTGLETIERMWRLDREVQVVVCTGSRCTYDQLAARFGATDALVVIKKPVEPVELVQAARALATKWDLARRSHAYVSGLEAAVRARTAELETLNAKLAEELAWRDRIAAELRITQRLEAVGQLAAGIAHEINTPIQYVGDNIEFIRESTRDLVALVDAIRERASFSPALARMLADCEHDLDFAYLRAELPLATESIQRGVKRISAIVGAMKELSHPGSSEAEKADINRSLESALEVTSNSWRYYAVVDKQLAPLPPVTCHITELGQVFLNLIVNAAHAMEPMGRTQRGRLGVKTEVDGHDVVIAISDTGCGIPEAIRHKIFDAFFTTKEVGRGTGQGLSIARAIIVERHGGTLTFDSVPDQGTTFYIRIPIDGVAARAA